MTSASRTEQDVRHVVELRRVLEALPEGPEKSSVRRVERELRRGLGVAVPKRVAARVLAISVTALDRWLEKGKLVEAHVPGTGRAQVEAWSLVQVALAAEQARADGVHRNTVAEGIRRLEAAGLLPFRARPNEHPLILRRDFLDSTPEQRLAEIDSLNRQLALLARAAQRSRLRKAG